LVFCVLGGQADAKAAGGGGGKRLSPPGSDEGEGASDVVVDVTTDVVEGVVEMGRSWLAGWMDGPLQRAFPDCDPSYTQYNQ
jgi:hypothetical protein